MSTTAEEALSSAQYATNGANNVIDRDIEPLRISASEELGRLVADVEDLVRKVAHITQDDIARVRERVEEKLVTARECLADGSARVRASGKQLAESTDAYVHERPWTAVGVAAAVGVLIGVLSSRR